LKTKPNKIDITQIDFEKLEDQAAEDPGLIAFPHNIGSAVIRPEDMGKTKGKAVSAMREQTHVQLMQLYNQMRVLAKQAHAIKERIEVSERIYNAHLNFEPVIGEIYYLYRKEDGSDIVSMIAPGEWGDAMPYESYVARIKLLSDHTWEVDKREDTAGNP
jgi:hypothetical protein